MKDWLKWLLLGVLSIAFGIFVLGAPVVASVAVTLTTGILFLVSGGAQIVGGFTAEGVMTKIFGVLLGVLMVFVGWSFLSHPLAGTLSLATVVMILFLVTGVARILWSFQMRGTGFFTPMLLSGLLTLALAIYLFANASVALAASLLGILLGIELLLNGIGLVFMGLFLRSNPAQD